MKEFTFALHFLGATDKLQNVKIDNIKKGFGQFDVDGNGIISIKGKTALCFIESRHLDGSMTFKHNLFEEYKAGIRNAGVTEEQLSDEQLKSAFNLFDLDRNGVLDCKVFFSISLTLNLEASFNSCYFL